MIYRKLGKSGLHLSALSFGSWVSFGNQIGIPEADRLMTMAYDAGVNFFDNAEVYADGKSEEIMGAVLAKKNWGRDTYCVSSKVFWGGEKPTQLGLNRKHIRDACHAALKRLKVEYLDLFFCHRPDPSTPTDETVFAMNDLIRQGKVMYWGTSEWSATQIQEAMTIAKDNHLVGPTMEQPEYNLFNRDKIESEYLSLYPLGLGTTTWSPLASGILTGKYSNGIAPGSRPTVADYEWLHAHILSEKGQNKVRKAALLAELAKEIGITPAQLSIAWCLKNPNVTTVILGATRPEQLQDNLGGLAAVDKLVPEVLRKIDLACANSPL